eukprot:6390048-Prymnesium_polylepis.1
MDGAPPLLEQDSLLEALLRHEVTVDDEGGNLISALQSTEEPDGPATVAADDIVPLEELEMKIVSQTVHRHDYPGDDRISKVAQYVVDKERFFSIELELRDRASRLAVHNADVSVVASVRYANGGEVLVEPGEPKLISASGG